MKVPVLFLIFNRPELSVKAFQSIKEYQPERLYIAADGPRESKLGEKEKCEVTRRAVLDQIDWDCDVKTLFRDENMGCDVALPDAISWFFNQEEYGIINEDDVILAQNFFRLCEDLLPRYKDNDSIMHISAQNRANKTNIPYSYGFSYKAYMWGWASWRRAWQKMDLSMKCLETLKFPTVTSRLGLIEGLVYRYYYWRSEYNRQNTSDYVAPWDNKWELSIISNSGISITPGVNLAVNVGCTGVGGFHYSADDKDLYSHLKLYTLPDTILHPQEIICNSIFKYQEIKDFVRVRAYGLFIKKIFNKFKL